MRCGITAKVQPDLLDLAPGLGHIQIEPGTGRHEVRENDGTDLQRFNELWLFPVGAGYDGSFFWEICWRRRAKKLTARRIALFGMAGSIVQERRSVSCISARFNRPVPDNDDESLVCPVDIVNSHETSLSLGCRSGCERQTTY